MKSLLILSLLVATSIVNAQIDTTEWYPLHKGDKWEYYGRGFGYSQVKVIGDTLMPNGNTYYRFSGGVYAWRFQRKDYNDMVYYYNTADRNEYMLFNFKLADRELWKTPFESHWWGILKTNVDKNNLFAYPVMYKIFERATIDNTINPPDTTWGYLMDAYPIRITKGFGITSYSYDLETLVGIIINGKSYGTLVGVDKNTELITEFKLYQNYPNPFNPTTVINYKLSASSRITLEVYDALGREVASLVNEQKLPGNYEVKFEGNKLTSGIYFYKLTTSQGTITKKMMLVK